MWKNRRWLLLLVKTFDWTFFTVEIVSRNLFTDIVVSMQYYRWTTDWKWIVSTNRHPTISGWRKYDGKYLVGYSSGVSKYESLEQAQAECLQRTGWQIFTVRFLLYFYYTSTLRGDRKKIFFSMPCSHLCSFIKSIETRKFPEDEIFSRWL